MLDNQIEETLSIVRSEMMQPIYEDPLHDDDPADARIVTTRRGLMRIALVAAEAASRFAREQAVEDPMDWMITPRRLFNGQTAIDGCLDRDACLRAVLLHGLSIGLDGDPDDIDDLSADDDDDVGPDQPDEGGMDAMAEVAMSAPADERTPGPRLWTSCLATHGGGGAVQAFDAFLAGNRREAEATLRARHGAALADDMELVEGFDPSLPLVEALVSPALKHMLGQVAAHPASSLADGLSVSVMQRFAA